MSEKEAEFEEQVERTHLEIWNNSKRAKNLLLVFWIFIGMTAVAIVSGYFEFELVKAIQLDGYLDEDKATANDARQGLIGIVQLVVNFISIVVFLFWFRRAYGNLSRIGSTNVEHKESMALWTWFIPVVSLFRPVKIMSEIWRVTQECIKDYDSKYLIKDGGLIIGLWWLMFIVNHIVGHYILRTAFNLETIEEMVIHSKVSLVSDVMSLIEAFLVILIVSRLSKMESKLAKEIEDSGGTVVYT